MLPAKTPLVWTIKDRCRVCYTCVRECPAKAIRVAGRKAEVIPERCVGCGHCVRVCSQRAKDYINGLDHVQELLEARHGGGPRVVAAIAPSFPAEFEDIPPGALVAQLRNLGFDLVCEVAFGADLVAREYRRLMDSAHERRFIATTCPALVGYVERYYPDMVPQLAPIVSPMIALSRAVRRRYGDPLRVVFIGPCIAKKGEATSSPVAGEIDAVLTFTELRFLLARQRPPLSPLAPSDFDPPYGGYGALFPIHRGLLRAAGIPDELAWGDVVAAGRSEFVDTLNAFETGDLRARLLEASCCDGCVMGPALSTDAPLFRRRDRVRQYVRNRLAATDRTLWEREMADMEDLDLTRTYLANDQRVSAPSREELAQVLKRMGKRTPTDELNCGACGYPTCLDHAVAVWKGLAESEMCLPYTIEELRRTCGALTTVNRELATTQEALRQSEKLAHMGQLAAGIAHEINNPLGTVLILSHVLLEEAGEDQARDDLKMIVSEADRCKGIVSGLLQFARKNKVRASRVDLQELAQRALRGAVLPTSIDARVEQPTTDVTAEVDGDQILQVLGNLISSAAAAMPAGGTLTIRLGGNDDRVWLSVCDTGCGVPGENRHKVFEPFFTTKAPGQGTGLGLAVSYGIVKMHRGDIQLESNADPSRGPTGTTFTVWLPRSVAGAAESRAEEEVVTGIA